MIPVPRDSPGHDFGVTPSNLFPKWLPETTSLLGQQDQQSWGDLLECTNTQNGWGEGLGGVSVGRPLESRWENSSSMW